jgi:hypothetical protein
MPLSNNAKNAMLDALAAVAVYASLHSGDPSTTGANEISGGSPAYARKAITWNAASGGNLDNNANPVFDVPASTTVAYVGLFSAVTSGTFYGSADVTDEVFAGQGTYTVTDFDVTLT